MQSINFCYWLQGLFELQDPKELTEKQTSVIKEHLDLVFGHDKEPAPFCSFLKGYFTVAKPVSIGERETLLIKNQLHVVFEHVIEAQPEIKPSEPKRQQFEAMC